jgi:tetratricopeptide (TPR) repeat protein
MAKIAYPRMECIIFILLVMAYGLSSYQRNAIWKDEMSLWSDVIKKSPQKSRPHSLLGVAYTFDGQIGRAIAEITKAISIEPHPVRYVALGNAYREKGLYDLAMMQYYKALSFKPDFYDVYVNIGNIFARKGLLDRAIAEYQKTIKLKPSCLEAYIDIASAYGLKENYDKTLYYLKKALQLDPHNPDAHYNLGVTYSSLGLLDEALSEYEKALAVRPDDKDALYNRNLIRTKLLYQAID